LKADADSFIAEYRRQKKAGVASPQVKIEAAMQPEWFEKESARQGRNRDWAKKRQRGIAPESGVARSPGRVGYLKTTWVRLQKEPEN